MVPVRLPRASCLWTLLVEGSVPAFGFLAPWVQGSVHPGRFGLPPMERAAIRNFSLLQAGTAPQDAGSKDGKGISFWREVGWEGRAHCFLPCQGVKEDLQKLLQSKPSPQTMVSCQVWLGRSQRWVCTRAAGAMRGHIWVTAGTPGASLNPGASGASAATKPLGPSCSPLC